MVTASSLQPELTVEVVDALVRHFGNDKVKTAEMSHVAPKMVGRALEDPLWLGKHAYDNLLHAARAFLGEGTISRIATQAEAITRAPEDLPDLKQCSICGQLKPSTKRYFYAKSNAADGLQANCKGCYHEFPSQLRRHPSNQPRHTEYEAVTTATAEPGQQPIFYQGYPVEIADAAPELAQVYIPSFSVAWPIEVLPTPPETPEQNEATALRDQALDFAVRMERLALRAQRANELEVEVACLQTENAELRDRLAHLDQVVRQATDFAVHLARLLKEDTAQ